MLPRSSSSPLAELYRSDEFINESANDVRFHVAMNLLHLRRYRKMSQAHVARLVGTSQSAIARIESGQENITLGTLERYVKALNGRFHVSIPPQERAPKKVHQWWAVSGPSASGWELVRVITRQTPDTEQAIVGFERNRSTVAGVNTTGSELVLAASGTGG